MGASNLQGAAPKPINQFMFDRVAMMNESDVTNFTPDLRVSAKLVIAVLVGAGVLFGFAVGLPAYTSIILPVAALILSFAAVDLLIQYWQPRLSAWLVVVSLIVILFTGDWLRLPVLVALMAIPTALAVALVGLPAGRLIAIGETVLVAWLWRAGRGSLDLAGASVSALLIWSVLGALWLVLRPVQEVVQSSWQYYEHAQVLLDEARTHRAELEEALADLAQANRQLALMNEKLSAARQVAEEAQKDKTQNGGL